MIYKTVFINKHDMYDKIGNMLNKIAESMADGTNRNLMSQYQPDGMAQDTRLLNDAFKTSMRKVIRCMAPYIDNTKNDKLELSPEKLVLGSKADEEGIIKVTADGEWTVTIDDDRTDTPINIYVIALKFPDTWLDNNIIQDQVDDVFTAQMMAAYLENVDKKHAEWYRKDFDDKAHELKTMCSTRKPGTRYYVTSPFGENPYGRY